MMRPRIAFTGYYGMRNFGDDLFGALCDAAAKRYWLGEPRLVGPPIAGVDARYTMPRGYPSSVYGSRGWAGRLSRYASFRRAVATSDVLVLGGGSVITARESFRKPLLLAAQRRGRLQLAALGVSIGPFDDAAAGDAAAEFLRHFTYVVVRDRRSHDWARRMGLGDKVDAGCDLAGLLPELAPMPAPDDATGRPLKIGFAPCRYAVGAYPAPDPRALQEALVGALRALARRRPLQVDVYSLNEHADHGDQELAMRAHRALQEHGIATRWLRYRDQSPLAMARSIGGCDAFISARLHGAVVAYLYGVPFAIVDYHRKCRDFADDIALPHTRRITARQQDEAAFSEAIEALLGGPAPLLSRDVYTRNARAIFQCAPWARPLPA